MNNPKVTIIVPIYNVEKYIDKCLKSLINQTFKAIQVFAVDDGSPDNSSQIVEKYSKKDPRIKLIKKVNGGYGSVLEYAISRINTEYFLVCDPDDWLSPNAVQVLYSIASKNNLDMVVADKYNVYIEDNIKEYEATFNSKLNIIPEKIYSTSNQIQKFSLGFVSPHAKLYKTKVSKNIKFPKHISYTDYILYVLSIVNVKRIMYHKEALAYYLKNRPGNTTTTTKAKSINDYLVAWNSAYKQLLSYTDIDILWYRMFKQLKYVVSRYAKVIGTTNNNKYLNELFLTISRLRYLKKYIKKSGLCNRKEQLLLWGLTNKCLYKFFTRVYIRKIKNKT